MGKEDLHISDEDLLLAVDGELSRRRAGRVREHIAACWDCRARMAEVERTIVDFVQTNQWAAEPHLPPIEGPRALLKARLGELARTPPPGRWQQLRLGTNTRTLAYACVLTLLLLWGGRILYQQAVGHDLRRSTNAIAVIVPNPHLTPGSTRPVTLANLCSGSQEDGAHTPDRVRQAVFHEYGLPTDSAADYELDYLITPGLGGSSDIRNLWPEPRYNTEWNSYVKDQLEDRLHGLVCGGQLSLSAAQGDIANNWIDAYKRYFHTDAPLPSFSASRASNFSDPD